MEAIDAILKSLRSVAPRGDGSVQIGWILPDGEILDLEAADDPADHMESVILSMEAAGDKHTGNEDALEKFFGITGAIRVCAYNYTMLHLMTIPTPAQIDSCCRIARYTISEEDDAGMEIFWHPADRLVQIKPLTAGRVRATLEALPGMPKGK